MVWAENLSAWVYGLELAAFTPQVGLPVEVPKTHWQLLIGPAADKLYWDLISEIMDKKMEATYHTTLRDCIGIMQAI